MNVWIVSLLGRVSVLKGYAHFLRRDPLRVELLLRGRFTPAIEIFLKHLIAHSEIHLGAPESLICAICQRRRLLIGMIVLILLIDGGQILIAISLLSRWTIIQTADLL